MAKKKENKTKGKTTSKRRDRQYSGLDKKCYSRIKQQYFDIDYVDQLNPEEKEWMSKFMDEYLGANLNSEGDKLHNSDVLKKDCFDRNNQRNRDITTNASATGKLVVSSKVNKYLENVKHTTENMEDELIEYIDSKKK